MSSWEAIATYEYQICTRYRLTVYQAMLAWLSTTADLELLFGASSLSYQEFYVKSHHSLRWQAFNLSPELSIIGVMLLRLENMPDLSHGFKAGLLGFLGYLFWLQQSISAPT